MKCNCLGRDVIMGPTWDTYLILKEIFGQKVNDVRLLLYSIPLRLQHNNEPAGNQILLINPEERFKEIYDRT